MRPGGLFVARPEIFNYETTIESVSFLSAKPTPEGKHYVIVIDNAPWHKKALRLVDIGKQTEYVDISEKSIILDTTSLFAGLNPI